MIQRRNASEQLTGLSLPGGWTVRDKLVLFPGMTGANFSVGYRVEGPDSRIGFLKAFDFTRAVIQAQDRLRELQRALEAYNYERDVLDKCRDRRLSHVATAIAQGSVRVAECEPLDEVHYLIFELASGDVRRELVSAAQDLVWRLRTLHEVSVGLNQLHGLGIAHQDVKASNILRYERGHSRLGDLGRACDRAHVAPHEEDRVAGDPAYAPPELLYRHVDADWASRRFGCDAYLLGGLVFFFIAGTSLTEAVLSKMYAGYHHVVWDGPFDVVLPYLISGFEEVVTDFEALVGTLANGDREIVNRLTAVLRQLGSPDPQRRGHPALRGTVTGRYRLDRYTSEFDLLARRAALQRRPV